MTATRNPFMNEHGHYRRHYSRIVWFLLVHVSSVGLAAQIRAELRTTVCRVYTATWPLFTARATRGGYLNTIRPSRSWRRGITWFRTIQSVLYLTKETICLPNLVSLLFCCRLHLM